MKKRSPATMPGYRKGQSPPNKGQVYPPSVMTDDDVLALILGCSRTSYVGMRDRALIALLYRSGLRISEALSLQVSDLRTDEHMVLVRRGKGGKSRLSAMDDFGWAHVGLWLEKRAELVDGWQGWVFCTVTRPDHGGRLHAPQVRTMLNRKARQAGLNKRVHPHAFRHGHAFGMANEGVPIPVISKQLGHSNIGTTSTYLSHVDPSLLVDAITSRPQPGAPRERDEEQWEKQARAAGWGSPIDLPATHDMEEAS